MNEFEELIEELKRKHRFEEIDKSNDGGTNLSDGKVVITIYDDLKKKIHGTDINVDKGYLEIIEEILQQIRSKLLVQASLLKRSGNFKESPQSLFQVESIDDSYIVLLRLDNGKECQDVIGNNLTEEQISDAYKLIEKIFNLGM